MRLEEWNSDGDKVDGFIKPIPQGEQLSLSVGRSTSTCEIWYQFGSDNVFQWLHQVTDVRNGSGQEYPSTCETMSEGSIGCMRDC